MQKLGTQTEAVEYLCTLPLNKIDVKEIESRLLFLDKSIKFQCKSERSVLYRT